MECCQKVLVLLLSLLSRSLLRVSFLRELRRRWQRQRALTRPLVPRLLLPQQRQYHKPLLLALLLVILLVILLALLALLQSQLHHRYSTLPFSMCTNMDMTRALAPMCYHRVYFTRSSVDNCARVALSSNLR